MICKQCGKKLYSVDKASDGECEYRKRVCKNCGNTVYTVEEEYKGAKQVLNKIRNNKQRKKETT